jgi:sterol desaturase/sphingolipid hydroxylase (fatty acid hydroxylase superfamily)
MGPIAFLSLSSASDEFLCGVKAAVMAGLLAFFFGWQLWLPFFHQPHPLKHAVRNLTITLLNFLLIGLAFGALTLLVCRWTAEQGLGVLNLLNLDEPWRFALAFVLLDAWMYFWHRLNHTVPILWRCHRMHHSDDQMDVTTATRFHLGELAASAVLRLALIPLGGFAVLHLILYDMVQLGIVQMHHANISVGRLDRWLSWLVVTPFFHKLHHSRWRPETDSNFASVLSFWDRLFGTYRRREDPSTIVFGLDEFDEEKWQTVPGMLQTPFVNPLFSPDPKGSAAPDLLLSSGDGPGRRSPSRSYQSAES